LAVELRKLLMNSKNNGKSGVLDSVGK
jgi:hypothetical protein